MLVSISFLVRIRNSKSFFLLAGKRMSSSTEKAFENKNKNSIGIIFRYADGKDILLMFLGTIGAIGDGISTNCLLVYVSQLFNSLGYGKTQQNDHNFMEQIEKVRL